MRKKNYRIEKNCCIEKKISTTLQRIHLDKTMHINEDPIMISPYDVRFDYLSKDRKFLMELKMCEALGMDNVSFHNYKLSIKYSHEFIYSHTGIELLQMIKFAGMKMFALMPIRGQWVTKDDLKSPFEINEIPVLVNPYDKRLPLLSVKRRHEILMGMQKGLLLDVEYLKLYVKSIRFSHEFIYSYKGLELLTVIAIAIKKMYCLRMMQNFWSSKPMFENICMCRRCIHCGNKYFI